MDIFGRKTTVDVLNAKFDYYERLSKEMLEKLEQAVQKISESNSNIASMLIKHEERITIGMEKDRHFYLELENIKIKQDKDKEDSQKELDIRLKTIEKEVSSNTNFRWKAIGMGTVLGILIGVLGTPMVQYLTSSDHSPRIQRLP